MHERTAISTHDAKPAILPPELTQETDAVPPLYLDTSVLDFRAITDTYTKIEDSNEKGLCNVCQVNCISG